MTPRGLVGGGVLLGRRLMSGRDLQERLLTQLCGLGPCGLGLGRARAPQRLGLATGFGQEGLGLCPRLLHRDAGFFGCGLLHRIGLVLRGAPQSVGRRLRGLPGLTGLALSRHGHLGRGLLGGGHRQLRVTVSRGTGLGRIRPGLGGDLIRLALGRSDELVRARLGVGQDGGRLGLAVGTQLGSLPPGIGDHRGSLGGTALGQVSGIGARAGQKRVGLGVGLGEHRSALLLGTAQKLLDARSEPGISGLVGLA